MPLLLLLAAVVNRLDAQITSPTEPAAPGSVTVSGTIVADGTGRPIAFSTVRLQPLGRERFTDQAGAFVYYAVPPGKYELHARQVGYVPQDTTIVVTPNIPVTLSLRMLRIATALDEVRVIAPPRLCLVPDELGTVPDSELSTVLGEAKKNAEREQLLRRWYPFEYKFAQAHDTYDLDTRKHTLQYDTAIYRSDDSWRYRRGKVVSGDRNKLFGEVRLMRLPTLSDLADRNFLVNHCFKYAGVVDQDGTRTHRIDFSPDSLLIAPDVEGSIFIDSATYKIIRAQFRLTRGGTVMPPILGMEVTTTYREILPNVALFDEIRSVQPLGVMSRGGNRIESHETQRLLSFRFLITSPPGVTGHKWIAVGSMTADSLANLDSLRSGRRPPTGLKQDQPPLVPKIPPSDPLSFPPSEPIVQRQPKYLM
ncbi:MAG TPA: carboxypeptidase regulatory-like domain-containing protein [Gemmatimonadaceae bacterium]|nr:carboxypeptidase regulatory-like domain-containing protein [Gemmatimonadaceae bacterium]